MDNTNTDAATLPGGARPKDPNLPCPHSNQERRGAAGRCYTRRGPNGTLMKRATPMELRRSSRIQRLRETPASIASVTARRRRPRTVAQLAVEVHALKSRMDRLDARIGTPSPSVGSAAYSPGWDNLFAAVRTYRGTPKKRVSARRQEEESAKSSELDALLNSVENSRGGSVRRKRRRNSIRSPMRGEA